MLSLYEINKNRIKNAVNYIFENNVINKKIKKSNINNSSNVKLDINKQNLKLVERIEELGFIPSKDNDSNAA